MLTHHKKAAIQTKIVSLADEARYIRRKEIKWKMKARKARDRQKVSEEGKSSWTYHYLRLHRLNVVRPEARATHIAYGFLRGLPYYKIERPTENANYYSERFKDSFETNVLTVSYDRFWTAVARIATKFQQPADGASPLTHEEMYKQVIQWRAATGTPPEENKAISV